MGAAKAEVDGTALGRARSCEYRWMATPTTNCDARRGAIEWSVLGRARATRPTWQSLLPLGRDRHHLELSHTMNAYAQPPGHGATTRDAHSSQEHSIDNAAANASGSLPAQRSSGLDTSVAPFTGLVRHIARCSAHRTLSGGVEVQCGEAERPFVIGERVVHDRVR